MDAGILTLRGLFSKDVRYVIPPFQRPYVWGQEEQWEPLWEDVSRVAEQYLDALRDTGEQRAAAEAATGMHFMGAIVAQQQLTTTAEIETRRVIDGQQRLTTLQLLLDAAQEVFEQRGCAPQATRLKNLVLNGAAYIHDDEDHSFKVWPTVGDQDAFRQAMRNELPSQEYGSTRIVQAHEFFKEQITEWVDESDTPEARAEALEVALAGRLQVVVIDLAHDDDPHVIFETLNARGTPLLDSDLVKNFLSSRGGDSEILHKRYLGMFEDDWWRSEIRQGRIYRPRVDVFLNYWLVMRKREEVPPTRVFDVFRRYHADSGQTAEDVGGDIYRIGETYKRLQETRDESALGLFLYRWDTMQAGVLTPVLMWLVSQPDSELPEATRDRALRAIESYLVRRMVCRMTAKDYNRVFVDVLERLEAAGPADADEVVIDHLKAQEAESRLWPDDRRLQEAFLHSPLYRLLVRARLRFVLEGIETELRSKMAESSEPPRNLTIEHVMPQTWADDWPLDVEPSDRFEATVQRNHALHTIGNLTLVTQPLNSKVSNGPWPKKREALAEHSVLHLNKATNLLAADDGEWDEAAIEQRGRRLAELAAEVWPPADAF